MGKLGWLHPATDAGIEHPLWNFHGRKPLELIPHALQNDTSTPACPARNQHSLPMPRVPAILDLSKGGFMGVSYLGCTTPSVPTKHWVISLLRGFWLNPHLLERNFSVTNLPDESGRVWCRQC